MRKSVHSIWEERGLYLEMLDMGGAESDCSKI